MFVPFEPFRTFIQKPGSVTLGCLTSWKKSEKNLIIQRSCIAGRWKDKQNQIYRTLLLGLVWYHVDVMDFQVHYDGTFL